MRTRNYPMKKGYYPNYPNMLGFYRGVKGYIGVVEVIMLGLAGMVCRRITWSNQSTH